MEESRLSRTHGLYLNRRKALFIAVVMALLGPSDWSTTEGGPRPGLPADDAERGMQSGERSAENLLWLLDQDQRTLDVGFKRILKKLDASTVPHRARAESIGISYAMSHGGLLAEEGVQVVGLLQMGRDVPPFASRGDLVWVVRISHLWFGVTQELWIGSASGEVRSMLPAKEK